MSEIYRARDLLRGQAVAVKLLHDSRAGEPRLQQEQRFQREAQLLEELAHPRIVRYVAHGVLSSGMPYLVMEWLDGEDLARTLARGRLGVADSVQIARGVAEALAAAHAQGIVHRDLKPSNVFLAHGSPAEVKLLDFGIADPDHPHRREPPRSSGCLATPSSRDSARTASGGHARSQMSVRRAGIAVGPARRCARGVRGAMRANPAKDRGCGHRTARPRRQGSRRSYTPIAPRRATTARGEPG